MKNPSIKTGLSEKKDPVSAIDEVLKEIKQDDMKLVVVFILATYDQKKVNKALREKISPEVPFLGCSSARIKVPGVRMVDNITSEGFQEGIVAMSISSDKIETSLRLMKNIKENWKEESERALVEAAKDLNIDPKNTDPEKFFGILICDFSSEKEEYILENLYARSNFFFIGGGSMGRHNLIKGVLPGWIHTHDGVFNNAAVVAVIKTEIPFKIDMTTSVVPTKTTVEITKAKDRQVFGINGKPAAKEYARLLGVPKIFLGTKQLGNYWLFTDHPFGLMVKDKAFIRDVAWRSGNTLMMASNAKEGEVLYLMEREDIVEPTKRMMGRIKNELGEVSGMLMFQCAYRFFETYRTKKDKELFNVLNIAPIIGLDSYGEYYEWASMAQTLTVLAFGVEKKL